MGLKTLYSDISTELKSIKNDDGSNLFNYIGIWNNHLAGLRGKNNNQIAITFPAIFSEVIIRSIEQLGQKHQLWNFDLRFHIIDDFYNDINGQFEENTRIFNISDKLWEHMQTIKLPMASEIVCTEQEQEHDHDNLYHYIQGFTGNYTQLYPEKNKIQVSGLTLTTTITETR